MVSAFVATAALGLLFGYGQAGQLDAKLRVSLAKMLSLANAFEISDFQEDEIGAKRTGRSECNNVTCPGGW